MRIMRRTAVVALIAAAGMAGLFSSGGTDIGAQQGGALELSRVCVNRFTGDIRYASGSTACTSSERAVSLPDDGPLFACASRYTGQLRAVQSVAQCQSAEIPLEFADVDVVSICVNRYTGKLRYAGSRANCTPSEFGGFVAPARVASIYVADSGSNTIKQFTLDGEFIREWGSPGSGPGEFFDLFRVAVGPDGYVYTTEAQDCRVQKFTYYGAFVTKWGGCGSGPGQFGLLPSGIAVDSQNNVFVGDMFNFRVQKFTSNGDFLTQWGGSGSGAGQFFLVLEIAVDASDNVFVADPAPILTSRVQRFDNNGNLGASWAIASGPVAIDIDKSNGIAYVTTLADTVLKIDILDGSVLATWGSTGSSQGEFDEPQGIAFGSNGLIYVSDRANDRVQVFDSDGTFVGEWGAAGNGPGEFSDIIGIAATP